MKHTEKSETSALSKAEEDFCQYYVNDIKHGNKARAAISAGYSPKTASSQASRLLKRVNVQARIEQLRVEALVHHRITRERILEEYESIAFLDPRSLFDGKGNLLAVANMPEASRRAVASFEVEHQATTSKGKGAKKTQHATSVKKVKLVDKKGGLDSLARFKGMFPAQKREVTGAGGTPFVPPIPAALVQPIIYLTVLPAGFRFPETKKEE